MPVPALHPKCRPGGSVSAEGAFGDLRSSDVFTRNGTDAAIIIVIPLATYGN
jgi:hypothetical protein